jgi:hypothetical protein
MSQETEADSQPERPVLLSRLNPLERNGKPPVPEERDVSPEYKAGVFSIITFSWMSSIMAVSLKFPRSFVYSHSSWQGQTLTLIL